MIHCYINIDHLLSLHWKVKYKYLLKMDSEIVRKNGKIEIVRDYMFQYEHEVIHVTKEQWIEVLNKRLDEMDKLNGL